MEELEWTKVMEELRKLEAPPWSEEEVGGRTRKLDTWTNVMKLD